MKRRNFLKGLAAIAIAPVAAVAKTDTSPAKIAETVGLPVQIDAIERGIEIYDAPAEQGQFTKKLIQLAKTVMRRNGGDNHDLYVSPEAMDDIRKWGIDQMDETTRREIMELHRHGLVSDGTVASPWYQPSDRSKIQQEQHFEQLHMSEWKDPREYWVGNNEDWDTPTNWDNNRVPPCNSDKVVFDDNYRDDDGYNCHIQNIKINTDFGRDEIHELGRRGPYHRFVDFPVKITEGCKNG